MPFVDVYMLECIDIIEYINDYHDKEQKKNNSGETTII
jgi:hypothetical protein